MATQKLFEVIQSDSILVLTLNRPKALNALNKQLIGELHHFFVKELKTYSCKGVILTGSGDRAFAAGADIKEFRTMDAREMEALSALFPKEPFLAQEPHGIILKRILREFPV